MAPRKRAAAKPAVTCDNHPGVPAAHTTTSDLHQPISLCEACLARIGRYLQDR